MLHESCTLRLLTKKEKNLKMIASTKVKAGIKLSMAVLSVGELYWIPTNEKIWEEHLHGKMEQSRGN